MNRVLIIGGGLAGLSAAIHLAGNGYKVKLCESSPKLGGRAYSFRDKSTGDIIDNGQHIMMGCYIETLNFLRIIGARDNISTQKKLRMLFTDKQKGFLNLSAVTDLYPLNLLLGILNFKALSFSERIGVIKFFIRLQIKSQKDLHKLSVKEWLKKEGQSLNAIKSLWEIITVGALNTSTEKASALMFSHILKEIFLKGSMGASIIIPRTGLSEIYCNAASEYIKFKGGDICLSSRVENIILDENKASAVIINNSKYEDFDFIISAVPFFAVNKLLPEDLIDTSHFIPSSILTVHIWLKDNPFKEEFYGLIDSEVHWIFNHKSYITTVISSADKYMEMSREEIFKIVVNEILSNFSYFNNAQILNFRVIKEKRATFVPANEVIFKRPDPKTGVINLFLAGDWINTGLPSTIEGAVKSGRLAADALLQTLR